MYTLVVGREGNQPFTITEEGVSRQHLQITVPDQVNGTWIVQDLGSSNGTFIQNEDGSFEQMTGMRQCTWDTVIRMGPDNLYGRTFWLCQLVQNDPNDFSMQFAKLNKMLDQFMQEKQELTEAQEKDKNRSAIIKAVVTGVASLGLCFLLPEGWGMARFALMPVVAVIIPIFFIGKKKPTQKKDYKAFLRCPNGKCGRPLSEHDIRRGQCPACKAHI